MNLLFIKEVSAEYLFDIIRVELCELTIRLGEVAAPSPKLSNDFENFGDHCDKCNVSLVFVRMQINIIWKVVVVGTYSQPYIDVGQCYFYGRQWLIINLTNHVAVVKSVYKCDQSKNTCA